MFRVLTFLFASLASFEVMAYVGPGLGLGTLGVILGVIASVLLALVAVVWYPMKRGWRRIFKKAKTEDTEKEKKDSDSKLDPENKDANG